MGSQTQNETTIAGSLKKVVWKNKYMSKQRKTRIYKTKVRSMNLVYGADTRAETDKT